MEDLRGLDSMRQRIAQAVASSGRLPGSVSLMAVSKTHPYEDILAVFQQGQVLFGENRVQEILDKFPVSHIGYQLHLIGHLQSNKVSKAVSAVDGIDSVDSLKVARLIGSEAVRVGRTMPVLLEFNTCGESAKSGFSNEDSYFSFLDEAVSIPGIHIDGLMTVGPLDGTETEVRTAFARLRALQEKSRIRYPGICFDTLSMGMSHDFIWAIEEGSTLVRIGTAIFGTRSHV